MNLSKTYRKVFTTQLIFKNVPINKMLSSDTINLRSTVEAKGWDLAFNKTSEEIILIDLDNYPIKKYLEFSDIKSLIQEKQNKINVIEVNPSSFKLEFINLQSKKVVIKPKLIKEFSPNYYLLKDPILKPDSVIISSNKETLEKIEFVESEEIHITEKDSVIRNIKILTDKSYRIDNEDFQAKFDISEYVEKEFIVDINIDNNKNDIELIIFPEQIKLKCLIPITIYENITASDFYISADFNNIEVQKNNKLLLSVKEKPNFVRNIQLQKDVIEFIIYE